MLLKSKSISIILLISACCIVMVFCRAAQAQDDGARAYWKTLEDTNMVSFQDLSFNADTTGSQVFDPGHGLYPNSETDLDIFLLSYARQIGLLGHSAMLNASIYGGDMTSELDSDPFNPASGRIRQTVNGFGDPSVGLTVNLYGAPRLTNFYDMGNYEPRITVDVSGLLTIPIGEYDNDKIVNIGQNRWWGRLAFPVVFYFGSYAPLYRTSLEVTPAVFIFDKNDDFLGQKLENDPLYQLEVHLTRDFTRDFFGSLDFMWREGFDTEIDGNSAGDELEVMTLGFTVDFHITNNAGLRFSYHSNFIDDDDFDADMLRIQFNYGWNALVENTKVLEHH
jgi:hypothetical protein